jgi:hypothetical protein
MKILNKDSMEDSIDIYAVVNRVINFVHSKLKIFISTVFTGFIIGIGYTLSLDKVYQSNMIGISSILTTEDVIPIISKIQKLLEEENKAELSKILKIDTLSIDKLSNIDITSQILTSNKKDKDEVIKNKFNITVAAKDPLIFTKLNDIIPELIRNNQYNKLLTEISIDKKTKLKNSIEREIKFLDSIKNTMTPGIVNNKQVFYVSNPSAINEAIIRLQDQKLTIEEQLQVRPDFLVIEDFAIYQKPINKKYVRNAVVAGSVFLILAILVSVFIEMLKAANKSQTSFKKTE